MDRQLFSVIVVFAAFGVNAILILFSVILLEYSIIYQESFSFRRDCPVCPVLDDSTEAGIVILHSMDNEVEVQQNCVIGIRTQGAREYCISVCLY